MNTKNLGKAFNGALAVQKLLELENKILALENEQNSLDIANDKWEDPIEDVSKPKKEEEHEILSMFTTNSSNIIDRDAHVRATTMVTQIYIEESIEDALE